MTTPIINPSSLTEEQREAIKKSYSEFTQNYEIAENLDKEAAYYAAGRLETFEWLFSINFFEKGGSNE